METLRADELEIGNILLNDDGTYQDTVLDKYDDPGDGIWLETVFTEGYVEPDMMFNVDKPYNE